MDTEIMRDIYTYGVSLMTQTVKNLPAVGKTGLDPCVGKIPWQGNGYPLQYSYLENSMDRGAWQATVPGATNS